MSLIPLGFWAASGGGVAGAYDLLETQILTSSASSVTFTGLDTLASGYQHLQIRSVVRFTSNGNVGTMKITMNADTGSNYAYHSLQGFGTSVTSFATSNSADIQSVYVSGSAEASNIFSAQVIDLLDFSSSNKNTTLRALSGYAGGNDRVISLSSGLYNSTNAMTSIKLERSGDTWVTGSRFSLYGRA